MAETWQERKRRLEKPWSTAAIGKPWGSQLTAKSQADFWGIKTPLPVYKPGQVVASSPQVAPAPSPIADGDWQPHTGQNYLDLDEFEQDYPGFTRHYEEQRREDAGRSTSTGYTELTPTPQRTYLDLDIFEEDYPGFRSYYDAQQRGYDVPHPSASTSTPSYSKLFTTAPTVPSTPTSTGYTDYHRADMRTSFTPTPRPTVTPGAGTAQPAPAEQTSSAVEEKARLAFEKPTDRAFAVGSFDQDISALAFAKPMETASQARRLSQHQTGEYALIQHLPYSVYFFQAAQDYDVSPTLTAAMATQESGFQPEVVSEDGAVGVMQLMPGTSKDMGVVDPTKPQQNIEGGTKYVRWLMDYIERRTEQPYDTDVVLAAYNWGIGNTMSAWEEHNGNVDLMLADAPDETKTYVQNINSIWRRLRNESTGEQLAKIYNAQEHTTS